MPRGRGGALGKCGLAISRSSLDDPYGANQPRRFLLHYPLLHWLQTQMGRSAGRGGSCPTPKVCFCPPPRSSYESINPRSYFALCSRMGIRDLWTIRKGAVSRPQKRKPDQGSSIQSRVTSPAKTPIREPLTFGPICVIFGSQVQRDTVVRPKFIDLFCGIGGMRLAFESAGAECVFSSDWDKYAQQTYAANFGHTPAGNIRDIQGSDIPDHDILVGGFPCQPFSISGVSKKNSLGRKHGFEVTRSTLLRRQPDATCCY